jgi:integrase
MARRGNGEGSISFHKASGRYYARYHVETDKGPKRLTIYGKTRAEVAEELTKALSDRDGGLIFDTGNVTVGEYLDRWLQDSVRGSVKDVTYQSYERLVRIHIKPAIGRQKLDKLSPAHLQGLYRKRLDDGYSPRTVQYIHVVLHRALKQALRWGMVPRNVAEAVDPPRVHREEVAPLSPEQVKTLLKTATVSGDRLTALYVLAVHTGLRQGELLGLKWTDIDNGTLHVNRTLSNGVLTAPKTKSSRRSIKLSQTALSALSAHRKLQLEERLRAGSEWTENGLVFPSSLGNPLSRHNLTRSWKRLLKRAGLPDTRFHNLRHTCATLLLKAGQHPKTVQALLGHANISITLDTYSHLMKGWDDGLGDAIDAALG